MTITAEMVVGMDAESKKKFKAEYEAAKYLMEPLRKVISKRIEELKSSTKEDYKIAAWPYYRADKDGSIRAYEDVLKLLP